jgi:hypothetical protein
MDRGVALKPGISTRAARAPVLMIYAAGLKAFDRAAAERLTRTAIGDYEQILEAEQPNWSALAEHNRGEILGGLAQGWLQLDDVAKRRRTSSAWSPSCRTRRMPRRRPRAAPIPRQGAAHLPRLSLTRTFRWDQAPGARLSRAALSPLLTSDQRLWRAALPAFKGTSP